MEICNQKLQFYFYVVTVIVITKIICNNLKLK